MSRHQAHARCDGGVLLIVTTGHGHHVVEHRFSMPLGEARVLRDSLASSIAAAEHFCDHRRRRIDQLRAEIEQLEAELACDRKATPSPAEGW